jgi:mRNA interferase MazF
MVMKRGELWWADLEEPMGSGPGYRRPVLVVQSDDFNRSRIQTVIVCVLTTNLKLAEAPGNIMLTRRQTGLTKDSVVNVSQLITIDKGLLSQKIAKIPPSLLRSIDKGLRLVMTL